MKVYLFYDASKLTDFDDIMIFKNLKDAEDMRNSMGKNSKDYEIDEREVVE